MGNGAEMKKRKLRKPRLEGWRCFSETIWKHGGGVMHEKTGRFWLGAKQLEKMGKFFLAAAAWLKEQEGSK